MIAVLLGSEKEGGSSWTNVRGRKKVRIRGVDGDVLRVSFLSIEETIISEVSLDCDLAIPEGCIQVRVDHVVASGNPVSVDLR